MGKKGFEYEIRGYRYAPESFRAFKGLPGQKMEQIPLSDEQRRKMGYLCMTYGFLIKGNPHRYVYCAELRCRESDPLAVRLDTLRAFRECLAQHGGRIEQSVECELDGNYRPVKVRKNYETADLSRPVVVWLYTA